MLENQTSYCERLRPIIFLIMSDVLYSLDHRYDRIEILGENGLLVSKKTYTDSIECLK